MKTPTASPVQSNNTSPILTCKTLHQTLSSTLSRNELEIDQLLALLADLLDQHNYRSLSHDAVDYYGDLNHLKARIHRLRADLVCEATHCAPSDQQRCNDSHFSLDKTPTPSLSSLTNDFNRMKENCYSFFAGLVRLNLI